jgi:long-chain acyl-CoA synthetase
MGRDTVVDRLVRNARSMGSTPALYSRRGGRWVAIDWKTYLQRCREFAGALLAEGYQPGDAVAIIGNNTPEWVIADVGAMLARGVATGIYQTNTPEQAAYIAAHCEAKVVVVEDRAQWAKIDAQRSKLPRLRKIVMMNEHTSVNDPLAIPFDAFLASGRAHLPAVDARFAEIQEADLATLIYTSGTTGPPKGAMLSHANLAITARDAVAIAGTGRDDCVVSYLPLSHIAEQLITIHAGLTAGYPVWFADSLDRVRDTMLAARPTVFMGVPRVWEKFKAALEAKLAEATGAKGAIVRWSRDVGLRANRHRLEHGEPTGLLAVQERIADRLFFSKLKAGLGLDRLRLAATGAAPISAEVLEFFLSCGIVVREGYGQTEGTATATFNRPDVGKTRIGTVGLPCPGTDVKIASDGEILVRGPGVFLGYFKEPEATAATVIDGWLYTGDIGEFDRDGFLRITDRKKDLIITSGGKNVAPQNLEKLLRDIPGISQAVVVGDRRKYLSALLTLDAERLKTLAPQRGWPTSVAEVARHAAFDAYVREQIEAVNAKVARYESIRKFVILASDFTQESGELTPTQKVKRKVVLERYAREVESMYVEGAAESAAG